MIGEVQGGTAIFWSRADRPSDCFVRWSLDPDFKVSYSIAPGRALPETDYTVRLPLMNLPPGRRIFYVAYFESLLHRGARSMPLFGEFSTASNDPTIPIRFAWSGDTFGQGYGINPQIGGVRIYDTIRKASPDVFIHCGDRIYADQPLKSIRGAGGGRRWYNLVTPELEKVAETLDEFRGYYRYGMLDAPTRRFAQTTSQIFLWDDHEVKNDWWPGQEIRDRRYTVKNTSVLANRSRRAFFEYTPLSPQWLQRPKLYRNLSFGPLVEFFVLDGRTYRGPNTKEAQRMDTLSPESQIFGPAQMKWIKGALSASRATWKVIICPQPLSVVVGSKNGNYDGLASGGRAAQSRELEVLSILRHIHQQKIHNTVWLSADIHYATAHHCHPDRGSVGHFTPFWEFVAGPLNAATLGPKQLDPTFGPQREFVGVPTSMRGGKSPLDGLQFYGLGEVDPDSKSLVVTLHNLDGKMIYKQRLASSQ
jgi:alkaline phosphatase D